ncbi:DUF4178 domain-containing protein [Dethiosulfatarculus sandiegensis]|nr:DUF4178 domain-containing protein [Dethiosulfatarculus sandiegensis]
MGFFDIFKGGDKKTDQGPDVTGGLTLAKLQPGWMVDYDLKTWEVKAHHTYDWSEGDLTHEWQLVSGDAIIYLELEHDDVDDWSLNSLIDFSRLGQGVKTAIQQTGDPPKTIVLDGVTYYMEEMAGGSFLKNTQGPGQNLLRWSYEDDDGEKYLTIEQWGEDEFQAYLGFFVEEYQFTDILPAA